MMHYMLLELLLKKELLLVELLYLRAKKVLGIKADNADEATGIQIVSRSESPLRTIVENAGLKAL
jgi:chaperonin GroEL (HSP60 family)